MPLHPSTTLMLYFAVESVYPSTFDAAPKMFISRLEQRATNPVKGTTTLLCTKLNWKATTKNIMAAPNDAYNFTSDFITGVLNFAFGFFINPSVSTWPGTDSVIRQYIKVQRVTQHYDCLNNS
jgi:hypothetical protein